MRRGCGGRVHSTYWRTLGEWPAIDRKPAIRLRGRRYFCDRKRCGRLTFVEQVAGLSERYRRSSLGLKKWLRAVAVELGGWAGERLCRSISVDLGELGPAQPDAGVVGVLLLAVDAGLQTETIGGDAEVGGRTPGDVGGEVVVEVERDLASAGLRRHDEVIPDGR